MAVILTVYAVLSVVTFVAFGLDKRAAKRSRTGRRVWRTPEATLHVLALLGGFPGALLGQQLFRHKTRKVRFILVLWVIIALHALIWSWWLLRQ